MRKAYLKKAAECHPDKHVGTSEEDRATEAFKAINGESHLRTPSPRSSLPSPGALLRRSSLGLRYPKCHGPGVVGRANTAQRLMRLYSTPTSERNTTRSSPHFAWRTAHPVLNPGLSPHTSRPRSFPFHPCSPCGPLDCTLRHSTPIQAQALVQVQEQAEAGFDSPHHFSTRSSPLLPIQLSDPFSDANESSAPAQW